MKTVRIALMGFGNAAKSFVSLLKDKEIELAETRDVKVVITAVATKSRGFLHNDEGVDIEHHRSYLEEHGTFDSSHSDYVESSSMELAQEAQYDILMEVTPLEIFSGEPAVSHIKTALNRGCHVVTANKGPLSWSHRELVELAREKNVLFYHETAVMDGTPVFNMIDETLKMCKIRGIRGILNSTTNYILEELEAGVDYDRIIAEGRKGGFIEADSDMDILGWDAAAKTAALMNVLMDADVTPDQIRREGIENIDGQDIEEAVKKNCKIKLMCEAGYEDGKPVGMVKPMQVGRDEIYSTISGTSSILSLVTDLMGVISIVEHKPEIHQTAYGLFSDMLRVMDNAILR